MTADEIDSTNILLLFKIQLALQEGPITIEATFSRQKLIILALHNRLHVPSSLQIQPVKKVQDRLVRETMVGELCKHVVNLPHCLISLKADLNVPMFDLLIELMLHL